RLTPVAVLLSKAFAFLVSSYNRALQVIRNPLSRFRPPELRRYTPSCATQCLYLAAERFFRCWLKHPANRSGLQLTGRRAVNTASLQTRAAHHAPRFDLHLSKQSDFL